MEKLLMEVLNVVAIVVAGFMVGSELAIAVFVHPTLDKLPDHVHLPAASALARVLGAFMPFWYILVFLLTSAELVIQWRKIGSIPAWFATSAVLWLLAILYTVTALVPINNRIKSWEKSAPPCRLEDLPAQMGPASPLACCAARDRFRVSDCGRPKRVEHREGDRRNSCVTHVPEGQQRLAARSKA